MIKLYPVTYSNLSSQYYDEPTNNKYLPTNFSFVFQSECARRARPLLDHEQSFDNCHHTDDQGSYINHIVVLLIRPLHSVTHPNVSVSCTPAINLSQG